MRHDPKMRRKTKGCLRSIHISTEMNQRERGQPKHFSLYKIVDHSKNKCPNNQGSTSQIANVPIKLLTFLITYVVVAVCDYKLSQILIIYSVSAYIYP